METSEKRAVPCRIPGGQRTQRQHVAHSALGRSLSAGDLDACTALLSTAQTRRLENGFETDTAES